MYTHGLDMVEIFPVKELHSGNTVAFGPDFDVDGMGFYEEDVVLIKSDGYELINPPLPYSAVEIERMMARERTTNRTLFTAPRLGACRFTAKKFTSASASGVARPAAGPQQSFVTLKARTAGRV